MRWMALCSVAFVLLIGCSPALFVSSSNPEESLRKLEQSLAVQEADPFRSQIEAVLQAGHQQRRLSAEVNAAWQIIHGVIAYGADLEIETADHGVCRAIDYAFSGGQLMGFELQSGGVILPSTGRQGLKARLEPGSYIGQGHVDQWLGYFAMADLPIDTPVQHAGARYTLLDWARQAQYDVTNNPLNEYSWTLIALTHYFPDEPTWRAADGSTVSWEDLVDIELDYDIELSPCGGAHRLVGIAQALEAKRRNSLADTPVWLQAETKVNQALAKVREQRAASGALSSYYFNRPGTTADLSAQLASSGHLLEFVALAAPREELSTVWLETAVERLCGLLERTSDVELECGALYHALNGLKIYHDRRF